MRCAVAISAGCFCDATASLHGANGFVWMIKEHRVIPQFNLPAPELSNGRERSQAVWARDQRFHHCDGSGRVKHCQRGTVPMAGPQRDPPGQAGRAVPNSYMESVSNRLPWPLWRDIHRGRTSEQHTRSGPVVATASAGIAAKEGGKSAHIRSHHYSPAPFPSSVKTRSATAIEVEITGQRPQRSTPSLAGFPPKRGEFRADSIAH